MYIYHIKSLFKLGNARLHQLSVCTVESGIYHCSLVVLDLCQFTFNNLNAWKLVTIHDCIGNSLIFLIWIFKKILCYIVVYRVAFFLILKGFIIESWVCCWTSKILDKIKALWFSKKVLTSVFQHIKEFKFFLVHFTTQRFL